MITRRAFVKSLLIGAAGIVAPAVAAEPARRLWALDGSMLTAAPPSIVAATATDVRRLRSIGEIQVAIDVDLSRVRAVAAELDAGGTFAAHQFADGAARVGALLDEALRGFEVWGALAPPSPTALGSFAAAMGPLVADIRRAHAVASLPRRQRRALYGRLHA